MINSIIFCLEKNIILILTKMTIKISYKHIFHAIKFLTFHFKTIKTNAKILVKC